MMRVKLRDAEALIREALTRLAESPRALGCFVIVQEKLTARFVQFATPPQKAPFGRGHVNVAGRGPMDMSYLEEPIYLDGEGARRAEDYVSVKWPCEPKAGAVEAVRMLSRYLPPEAEVEITEDATRNQHNTN
jgi:hypothetical protein